MNKVELFQALIESSSAFTCGNINYRIHRGERPFATVFGKDECFHSLSFAGMIESTGLTSWMNYNQAELRVELHVCLS